MKIGLYDLYLPSCGVSWQMEGYVSFIGGSMGGRVCFVIVTSQWKSDFDFNTQVKKT